MVEKGHGRFATLEIAKEIAEHRAAVRPVRLTSPIRRFLRDLVVTGVDLRDLEQIIHVFQSVDRS